MTDVIEDNMAPLRQASRGWPVPKISFGLVEAQHILDALDNSCVDASNPGINAIADDLEAFLNEHGK